MSEWKEWNGSDEQIAEIDYIKSRLNYDKDTGRFTWSSIDSVNSRVKIGSIAGTVKIDRCGISYLRIYVGSKRYYAQRLAWMFVKGYFPQKGMEIDHIDGNGLNNSIINLRCVTKVNNQRNKRITKRNTSGKLGVCFCNTKKKWTAQIGIERHRKHLGYFDTLDDAIQARINADIKYGFHPGHGKTA